MSEKIAIVMDCGATNVRTVAIDAKGKILAMKSFPNNTQPDPENNDMVIWDAQEIWGKLCNAAKEVTSKIDKSLISAVTVTTFGVDGAPFDESGNMQNPVISWKCNRTKPVMDNIDKYMPLNNLYLQTGVQPAAYNTINKIIWLKENRPQVFENSSWLFISSIFLYYLSGSMVTDQTMAGTSMMTDLKTGELSDQILKALDVSPSFFPKMAKAGDVVGTTTADAEEQTGIPQGIPVVSAGHDTQFAIYGSGAGENEFVLSSGTWEILMVRSKQAHLSTKTLNYGITTELDPVNGIYNMGVNAVASGIIEWVKNNFFSSPENISWETIIEEAQKEPIGSNGVFMHPNFFTGAGTDNTKGTLLGLSLNTTRGSIFRATLEALSCQTRKNLELLQETGGFKSDKLIVVGGGSKNMLWNQIRADITGIPVHLISQKETTVLGAALFAFAGVGVFDSAEEARKNIDYNPVIIEPKNHSDYDSIYKRFLKMGELLSPVYNL